MRWLFPAVMTLLLASTVVAFASSASAAGCVGRFTSYGGVVGLTDAFVADTANAACEPQTDPSAYSDATCAYLWGVDCAHIPDQVLGLLSILP